jgi:hypothetical protein
MPANEITKFSYLYIHEHNGQTGARSSRLGREQGRADHFGSYVCSISLYFCKRLFSGIELMNLLLMVTRQQLMAQNKMGRKRQYQHVQ